MQSKSQGFHLACRRRYRAVARGGRAGVRHHHVGRGDADPDRRLPHGAPGARRDGRRDRRRRLDDARQDDASRRARRRDRHRRHGRRRFGHLQHLHLLGASWRRRCGVPVAKHGNRALSSQLGCGRRAAALGVNIELGPDGIAECISDAGHRLHVRAVASFGDEACRPERAWSSARGRSSTSWAPCPTRPGRSASSSACSRRRWIEPMADVLGTLGAERGLGRARQRRPRRDHHDRSDIRCPTQGRQGLDLRDRSRRCRRGAGRAGGPARRRRGDQCGRHSCGAGRRARGLPRGRDLQLPPPHSSSPARSTT